MKYDYELITTKIHDEAGTSYEVYGILCKEKGTDSLLRSVYDIFCDISAAESFVTLCNHLELSPEHLDDVIEDIISAA